jgi:hypothetical protein
MTRRKFIQALIKTGAGIIAGTCWLAQKAVPRKFVRAVKLSKFPGLLRPLKDIHKQGKWSG